VKAPYSRTLFDLLREQSEKAPQATAVVSRGVPISYDDLCRRSRAVAASLRARGVKRGDRVGAILCNCVEWLEMAFGSCAAGATFVPLSTWSTRNELEFLLADSQIKLLVSHARLADRDFAADFAVLAPELGENARSARFPGLEGIVLLDADASTKFGRYDDFVSGAVATEDLPPGSGASASDDALILYTSGSSAHPKAVRLKHYGVVENGFNIGERMALGPSDSVLLSAPLFWSYGSANALPATMTHGGTLVLQERFEAAGAIDLIEKFGCTAIYTLPGMTKAIITHPQFARARLGSLRTGLTIGTTQEFLFAVNSLGASQLCNIYGATETYGNCCVTSCLWPVERRAICQGEPLPGNELRFVDVDTGEPVRAGEIGLTEVRGYVTAGYSGASSDQNTRAFTADGFYRTGDVGKLDENGAFVFVGRNTEMIKRAGINVSPAEVENILLTHPGVSQAAVVGVADPERGELVVAFVVPSNASVTTAELIAHCRSVASKYKVPDRILMQSSLPLTSTGKLQRRQLKQTAVELVVASGGRSNG
jgi:fatty-acyl-CoA synthase